ncbi:MAG: protein translocase subunit SecF [Robiginitomaculum sp.]
MRDISLVRFLPSASKVPFIGMRMVAAVLSVIAIIASIFLFSTRGLNYGIDFVGGAVIEFPMEETPDVDAIRTLGNSLNVGDVQVQTISRPNQDIPGVRLSFPRQTPAEGEDDAQVQQDALTKVQAALSENFGVKLDQMSSSVLGSKVSGELRRKGIISVVAALSMVLIYIWIRFEWQFALGAVLALAHDVTLTIGVFSLTQMEFSLAIVAAILTIVGYSLNDTVIVYDRIRENLRKYKKRPLGEVLNLSINDTLSRTILTSVTTLLALLSLYVLGGAGLRGFSFAMIWGVFVGTYSSIFVASPLLLALGVNRSGPSSES